MLIDPKRTRFALAPLISTGAGRPRTAQPACKGGNKRRSVSSSAKSTLRGGRFFSRRRMARFFLALGVGRQDVAEPLPHVVQASHLTADGVVGQPLAPALLQIRLEKGDGPVRSGIAQLVRTLPQSGQQQSLESLRPNTGSATAGAAFESCCTAPGLKGPRPVVYRLPRHPEPLGDLGGGFAFV